MHLLIVLGILVGTMAAPPQHGCLKCGHVSFSTDCNFESIRSKGACGLGSVTYALEHHHHRDRLCARAYVKCRPRLAQNQNMAVLGTEVELNHAGLFDFGPKNAAMEQIPKYRAFIALAEDSPKVKTSFWCNHDGNWELEDVYGRLIATDSEVGLHCVGYDALMFKY